MSEIILEKRYPHSRSEDITDAFMRGYVKGKADRPQGEWIDQHENGHEFWVGVCSQCGKEKHVDNYCPNCGAQMMNGKGGK